jgi:hypothetical protein
MKPMILNGEINSEGHIQTKESISSLRKLIEADKVVIIKDVFDKCLLDSIKNEVFDFGQETEEKNMKTNANTGNFHRIDDNHPAMSVKRVAHFFRYSYSERKSTSIFEVIHPLNILRNQIAELDTSYSFYDDESGYVSQPAALHYPCGGGYMQAHSDPIEPQKVEMVCSLSERGKDFISGGLAIYQDKEWHDVEQYIAFGDICMFKPDSPHRVEPIDPEESKSFDSIKGRWTVFSPIAHMTDETKNEVSVVSS